MFIILILSCFISDLSLLLERNVGVNEWQIEHNKRKFSMRLSQLLPFIWSSSNGIGISVNNLLVNVDLPQWRHSCFHPNSYINLFFKLFVLVYKLSSTKISFNFVLVPIPDVNSTGDDKCE